MPRLRLVLALLALLLPRFAAADILETSCHIPNHIPFNRASPESVYVFSPGVTLPLTTLYGTTNATLTRHGATFGSISYTAASAIATADRFAHASSQTPLDVVLFRINPHVPTGFVANISFQDMNMAPDDTSKDLATPEPATLLLLLPGTIGMGLLMRRRL